MNKYESDVSQEYEWQVNYIEEPIVLFFKAFMESAVLT